MKRTSVEVVTARGRRAGTIFLAGESTIEGILEDDAPFFPLERDGRVALVARTAVVALTLDARDRARGSLADYGVAYVARAVRVHLSNGEALVGDVLVAHGARRMLDLFNDPTRSVAIHAGDRVHLVAKSHVQEIEELG